MVLSWQFGAVRTDRGDQFSRRDLIAHLAVDARLARIDVDQQQALAIGRGFEPHGAPHARGERVAVGQEMDGAVRAVVRGCHRSKLLKRLTGGACKSSPFESPRYSIAGYAIGATCGHR